MTIAGAGPGLRWAVLLEKKAWSEDVHLKKRMDEGSVATRAEYRRIIADTLRAGKKEAFYADDGLLHYHNEKTNWLAAVQVGSGRVVTAFPLEGETWAEFRARKARPGR